MREAIRLARRGEGRVHPNPLVGAVLVKNGRVIGRGFHAVFGGAHAEVAALENASQDPKGSTLYVNLEPCSHFGKTPPCADLLIRSGIKRVIIGTNDPNPLVRGRGIARLKQEGIPALPGVLEKECRDLNKGFFHWIKSKMPYVTVKIAQSLDGKIATREGESQWITGKEARSFSHGLRRRNDAVLVGVNTVLKDDPLLSVRLNGGHGLQPLKVILDSELKTPPNARIFSKDSPGPVLLAVTKRVSNKKIQVFKKSLIRHSKSAGRRVKNLCVEILRFAQDDDEKVDLKAVLKSLGKKGVLSALIEGGGEVIGDAFSKKLVNEVYFFIAPMIIGGRAAPTSVGGDGISRLEQAVRVREWKVERLGEDFLFHGFL